MNASHRSPLVDYSYQDDFPININAKDYAFLDPQYIGTPQYNAEIPVTPEINYTTNHEKPVGAEIADPQCTEQFAYNLPNMLMIRGKKFQLLTDDQKKELLNMPSNALEVLKSESGELFFIAPLESSLGNQIKEQTEVKAVPKVLKKAAKAKKEKAEKPKRPTKAEKPAKDSKKKKNESKTLEIESTEPIYDTVSVFMEEDEGCPSKVQVEEKFDESIECEESESLDASAQSTSHQSDSTGQENDEFYTKLIASLIDKDECYKIGTKEEKGAQAIFGKVSEELLESVRVLIERKAVRSVSHTRSAKDKDKEISQAKSYFNKNFPKKVGDLYCDYIINGKHISTSKEVDIKKQLKDTLSWKKLNDLLTGKTILCPEIDSKRCSFLFKCFVLEYDIDSLEKSKTKDETSKYCHKIVMKSLKAAFAKLDTLDHLKDEGFQIKKAWPNVLIHFSVSTKSSNKAK